ncbi:MAG: hypothetical protein JNJ41_19275 [Bacteroidia bacterium]|nr:hypothetical protein [Bacteroidia bacterium]
MEKSDLDQIKKELLNPVYENCDKAIIHIRNGNIEDALQTIEFMLLSTRKHVSLDKDYIQTFWHRRSPVFRQENNQLDYELLSPLQKDQSHQV